MKHFLGNRAVEITDRKNFESRKDSSAPKDSSLKIISKRIQRNNIILEKPRTRSVNKI